MTETLATASMQPDLTLWDRIMSSCDPETCGAKVVTDSNGQNRYVREWAAIGATPSGDGRSFMTIVQTEAPSKPRGGKHRPENLPTLSFHLEQTFGHRDWGNLVMFKHIGTLTGSNLVELTVVHETQCGPATLREPLEPASALAQTSVTLNESTWNSY